MIPMLDPNFPQTFIHVFLLSAAGRGFIWIESSRIQSLFLTRHGHLLH